MHRRFIALILSASLVVTTAGAAPARADDTEKWIAGAAALAIIGLAIHEESKKNRRERAIYQNRIYNQGTQPNRYHQGHGHGHGHKHAHKHGHGHKHGHKHGHGHGHKHGHGYGHKHPLIHNKGYTNHSYSETRGHAGPIIVKPRRSLESPRHRYLPKSCLVSRHLRGQKIYGFARGCLKRSNVRVDALPAQCRYKIFNPNTGKSRIIFGKRCMTDRGYQVATAH